MALRSIASPIHRRRGAITILSHKPSTRAGHAPAPRQSARRGLTLCGAALAAGLIAAGCAVDQKKEVSLYRRVVDDKQTLLPSFIPRQPLTLLLALSLANDKNERLDLSGENYLQALVDKDRAWANFQPQVSLSPVYYWQKSIYVPPTVTSGIVLSNTELNRRLDVPVSASWNLFNGFRDEANLRRAKAAINQQRALLLDAQQQLMIDVASAYYQVLRSERSVDVLKNSLQLQEQRVTEMHAQSTAGLARPLDVAQTEADEAATQVTLTRAMSDVTNARSTLSFLVNVDVTGSRLPDDFNPPPVHGSLDDLLQESDETRQDLRGAQTNVEASRQNVASAIGQYYPTVSISPFNYFLHHESAPPPSIWNGMIEANLPIFTGGQIRADVRTAWSQYRQARLNFSLLRRQVHQDVQVAYQTLRATEQSLSQLRTEVAAAAEAYRQADRSYDVGLATYLDRLTAQDRLLSAQLDLASSLFDWKVQYLNLMRVTGKLTNPSAVQSTSSPTTRP